MIGELLSYFGLNEISKEKGVKTTYTKLESACVDRNYDGVKSALKEVENYVNNEIQNNIDKGESKFEAKKSAYEKIRQNITSKYKEQYQKAYLENNSRECAKIKNVMMQLREYYRFGKSVEVILSNWRNTAKEDIEK